MELASLLVDSSSMLLSWRGQKKKKKTKKENNNKKLDDAFRFMMLINTSSRLGQNVEFIVLGLNLRKLESTGMKGPVHRSQQMECKENHLFPGTIHFIVIFACHVALGLDIQ